MKSSGLNVQSDAKNGVGIDDNHDLRRRCAMIRYEIRNQNGRLVDINILKRFYGSTWQSILDRLYHRHDGFLLSIHERERELRIYRILAPAKATQL